MNRKQINQNTPDISNPMHYIAWNNAGATVALIMRYTGIEPPLTEIIPAVDYCSRQFGKPFIDEMVQIHPDTPAIVEITGLQPALNRAGYHYSNMIPPDYKSNAQHLSADELRAEIRNIELQLSGKMMLDPNYRAELLEKLDYLKNLLLEKMKSAPAGGIQGSGSPTAQEYEKRNHYILMALLFVSAMFLGAKLIDRS